MTIPVTTPMPKDRAKTFSQKSKTRRYTGSPVASRTPSIVASQAARRIVKERKMMWKLMTNANCMRDRITGSRSMDATPDQRSRDDPPAGWRMLGPVDIVRLGPLRYSGCCASVGGPRKQQSVCRGEKLRCQVGLHERADRHAGRQLPCRRTDACEVVISIVDYLRSRLLTHWFPPVARVNRPNKGTAVGRIRTLRGDTREGGPCPTQRWTVDRAPVNFFV